jgi:signal transduction histidine kinase
MFADIGLILSRGLWICMGMAAIGVIYVLFVLIKNIRKPSMLQTIFLIGVFIIGYASLRDIFTYLSLNISGFTFLLPPFGGTNFARVGVIGFLLCQAAAVFIATMNEVEKAKQGEREAVAETAALEREKKFRDDVMATVSHEMRTPLTVMSVYAEMAVKQIREGNVTEQTITDLDAVSEEALRLAKFADNALEIFTQKDNTVKNTSVDIGGMALQIANLLTPAAKSREIEINVILPEDLSPCWGSPANLTRLMWNLFDNALKHTDKGTILVSGKTADGKVIITITDSGKGMNAETLSRVFERGFSGGNETTGLGLAFCKKILEAHGGEIFIESELGKGTVVTIKLPEYLEDIVYE